MSKNRHKYSPSKQAQVDKALQHQEGKQELAQEVVGIVQQSFSGPIPPPNVLEKYNQIIPNGAERIMLMAEEQGKHRRELEKKALNTDAKNSLLGVICAFILGMTAIIAGAIVAIQGYSLGGSFLGTSGLVSLVFAFIYGTRERRKERESKAKKE